MHKSEFVGPERTSGFSMESRYLLQVETKVKNERNKKEKKKKKNKEVEAAWWIVARSIVLRNCHCREKVQNYTLKTWRKWKEGRKEVKWWGWGTRERPSPNIGMRKLGKDEKYMGMGFKDMSVYIYIYISYSAWWEVMECDLSPCCFIQL